MSSITRVIIMVLVGFGFLFYGGYLRKKKDLKRGQHFQYLGVSFLAILVVGDFLVIRLEKDWPFLIALALCLVINIFYFSYKGLNKDND